MKNHAQAISTKQDSGWPTTMAELEQYVTDRTHKTFLVAREQRMAYLLKCELVALSAFRREAMTVSAVLAGHSPAEAPQFCENDEIVARVADFVASWDASVAKAAPGQQLFARLKKSSKYYHQTKPGELFPVLVVPKSGYDAEYVVQGGVGGQYRLADVNLFVVGEDGSELRIS